MNLIPSTSFSSVNKTAGYALGTMMVGPLITITVSEVAQKLFKSESNPGRGFLISAVSAYTGAQTAAALAYAQSRDQSQKETWRWAGVSFTATALCLGIFYYQTSGE